MVDIIIMHYDHPSMLALIPPLVQGDFPLAKVKARVVHWQTLHASHDRSKPLSCSFEGGIQ